MEDTTMSGSAEQLPTTDQGRHMNGGEDPGQRDVNAATIVEEESKEEDRDEGEGDDDEDDEGEDAEVEDEDDDDGEEESAGSAGSDGGGDDDDGIHDTALEAVVAAAATDITATCWAFLSEFLLQWLNHSSCEYTDSLGDEGLRFHSFAVYTPGSTEELVRMRHAAQLVAGMLHVDPEAWWFLRSSHRPWFRSFIPTVYDQATLIPKMVFRPRRLLSRTEDDDLEGVHRLHDLFLATDSQRARTFEAAKMELLQNHDPDNNLRDFTVPIGFVFSPEEPRTREALQQYLRSVVELVEGLQQRSSSPGSEFPFRLQDIQLTLYHLHLDFAQGELRRLVSLGVPVRIHIRHLTRSFRDHFMCKESGHVYAALAENPHPVTARAPAVGGAVHKLEQTKFRSSADLWSAVAFAPSLSNLAVWYEYCEDPVARRNQVKWLSFALRNGSLRSLQLDHFQPQLDDMVAFREIAESPDPVRLLASSPPPTSDAEIRPQVVRFKANALIQITSGESKTLHEVGIETDWRLPVVAIHSQEQRVEFVVPGYAVCSASMPTVASIDTVAPMPPLKDRGDTGLRSLHVESWYQHQPGLAARFLEMYGQSLIRLRWDGNENANFEDDAPFDEDLEVVLSSCPNLESLKIQHRRLYSLETLLNSSELPALRLRKLTLKHAAVPPHALVEFLTHLANPRNRLAKTLESFKFESYVDSYAKKFVHLDEEFCCVDVAVIDAALATLRTNRTLSYFSLGIPRKLWKAHHRRFDAEKGVRVKTSKRLPLRERLAFVSVAQSPGDSSNLAIQQLDSACMAVIFDFFTHRTIREVVVKKMGY